MIEVTQYYPYEKEGSSVIANVSFYIPKWGLYLNGCRLVKGKNGGEFIGFPSSRVEKEGEEPKYHPLYTFDKEVNRRFQESAKKAISEYIDSKK